ncbi:MAG: 2-dehydropantoate 2-reductase [Lachnospiraceae bacterium]|nr:2-dehydropantoate 2-reductase [Lachnospiraceae bacterium]
MNIYIDFDDCLCETARYFSELVKELFDKDIPYEKIKYFDLLKSFSLTEDEFEYMMIEGHKPEILLSYDEVEGASETLNSWLDCGHQVSIITGRPFSAYEPSREWLDQHGLENVDLYCLNKYGRDSFIKDSDFSLELEDYYKMHFDYAIEDSPMAFKFFNHLPKLKVLVFDRPWNQDSAFPSKNYKRCTDWNMIKSIVDDNAI